MREQFEVSVNRKAVTVDGTTSVAVAILRAGIAGFRKSPCGQWRGPLCGMGICAECRASIDGVPGQYSCQRWCHPGMQIVTEAAGDDAVGCELEER